MNNNYPLISVIVPIYKVEKYLSKCIESILKQTYGNLEIILVDDGSPDKCGEICDDYALKDKRIKVIHKQNGGLSSARNVGIDISEGEYIGFVDSDDYIEPYMYEKLYYAIEQNNCRLSVCNINYVFENGKIIPKCDKEKDKVMDFEEAITEMNTYRIFDMGAWSKLYHKDLFKTIRFPIGKLSEDFFVMPQIFDLAQKIVYISTPCYNYLQRQNSITKSKKINYDFIEAAFKQMNFLDVKYPQLKVLSHTAYASANLTVYDFYIKNGVKCSKDNVREFKSAIRENKSYIKKANFLSKAKKLQFQFFLSSHIIYNFIFKVYRKIKIV